MVGKRQNDLEGDLFPRGAAPNATPRVRKRDGQTLFGAQLKRPRVQRPAETSVDAPVTRNGAALSLSRLSVGMTVLGLVTKADRTGIQLVLSGGLRAVVARDELLVENTGDDLRIDNSDVDSSDTEGSDASVDQDDTAVSLVWQVVHVGEIVRAAVVDIEVNNHGKKLVSVSLKPHLVNVGLNPKHVLSEGFPVYGAIKSVEDHGYVVSLGASIPHTAFLPFEKQPGGIDGEKLSAGTPVSAVTSHEVKLPKKRPKNFATAVRVSATQGDVLSATVDVEGVTFQDLQAGMLVRARVMQEGPGGVSLSALGLFNVDVDASHVPRTADGSWDVKVGKHVLARLLYVDPTNKRIGASLLESYVSQIAPRDVPSHWRIGTRLKTLRVERVKAGFGLILSYVEADGDAQMKDVTNNTEKPEGEDMANADDVDYKVPVFAHISRVSDSKGLRLEEKYHKDMLITDGARIVSVSKFDGLVNVDLRPSVLARKALSIDEIEVGVVYDCKILSHSATGSLMVAVDGDPYLTGVILPLHISDVPIPAKRLGKHPALRVGASLKCRVLYVRFEKGKIFLTARKSLTSPKYPVLISFEQAAEAMRKIKSSAGDEQGPSRNAVFAGTVLKVTSKNNVIVEFCNKIVGLVHSANLCLDQGMDASQSEIESVYPVGETVHTRVLKVDNKNCKITLSMSLNVRNEHKRDRMLALGQRVRGAVTGADTEAKFFTVSVSCSDRSGDTHDGSDGEREELRKNSTEQTIECHLPFGHLSDISGMAERLEGEVQRRLQEDGRCSSAISLSEAMVLSFRDQTPILSMKPSLKEAAQAFMLPQSFEDVQKIMQRGEGASGKPVGLRGYVKALLPGGVIVGFLGDSVGFVRKSRIADHFISDPARALRIHQTVHAIVESVDASRGRFALSMRPSDVGSTGTEADTLSFFQSVEQWQAALGTPSIENVFPIGSVIEASISSVSTYGVKYDLNQRGTSAVGAAYGTREGDSDIVMKDTAVDAMQSELFSEERQNRMSSKNSKKRETERVRILDVDPLTGVVDLSRDNAVISAGEKKSVITPGSTMKAKIVLVKSTYIILAVQRSKSRSAIAYALGPVVQDNLMIRPGASVECKVLDKARAGTRRNLVVIDWESFRGASRATQQRFLTKESDYASTISVLRNSASHDETAAVGMKVVGKATRRFLLHAYIGIAPGVVGQVHVTNTSSLTDEERTSTPLGVAPAEISSRFVLPDPGTSVRPAYVAGIRRNGDPQESDPVVVEISLSKERCSPSTVSKGDRVLGFIKNPSSRFARRNSGGDASPRFTRTLVAIDPSTTVSCADVDCLFDSNNVDVKPGTPVVCQIIRVSEEEGERVRGTISENGKQKDGLFLAIVQSVDPGRGLRVSIPWFARDEQAKSVTWGTVDVCDVADDFSKAVEMMEELKQGDVVRVRKLATVPDETKVNSFKVILTMRSGLPDRDIKDPLITPTSIGSLKEGTSLRGFVRGIGKKGCFVAIGRDVTAHVKLCDLSDEFVRDPKKSFPLGKLVSGTTGKCRPCTDDEIRVPLVLRKRPRKKLNAVSIPSELREGSKVCGIVRRMEDYGALLEISPGLIALLHKSEADQDRFVKDPREEWAIGQKVTSIVIKIDKGKIGVGTKRCYFEAAGIEEDKVDDILAQNEASKGEQAPQISVNIGDAIRFEKEEPQNQSKDAGEDEDKDEDKDGEYEDAQTADDSNRESDVEVSNTEVALPIDGHTQKDESVVPLDIPHSFNFSETRLPPDAIDSDAEETGDEVTREEMKDPEESSKRLSRDKREKKRRREAAEMEIRLREEALANNPDAPETTEDYERLLMGEPNSSVLWIRYMAFCLQLSQVDKARSIAERALETISLQAESERTNVWCAYVNLEAQFGSLNAVDGEANDSLGTKRAAAVFRVFEKACERITDVKNFHLQIANALRQKFPELADEVLRRAIRRFKGSRKVWIATGQAQFVSKDLSAARRTLERALMTLDKRKHIRLITKFAQFEYKYGSVERGRTVFESLVGNFPKRVDLWNIYLDMETTQCNKASDEMRPDLVQRTRQLYERFGSLDLSSKKMKFAFKKWLRFEKDFGSKVSELEVKARARQYVEKSIPSVPES